MASEYYDVSVSVQSNTMSEMYESSAIELDTYKDICQNLLSGIIKPYYLFKDPWRRSIQDVLSHVTEHLETTTTKIQSNGSGSEDKDRWTFSAMAGALQRKASNCRSLTFTYPQLEITLSKGEDVEIVLAIDRWGLAKSFILLSHDLTVDNSAVHIGKGRLRNCNDPTKELEFQGKQPSLADSNQDSAMRDSGGLLSNSAARSLIRR